ncbi:MAG: gliding motility lipoprotein GldH [Flavobacteriales bacterium]|nr:gliding motility lipoprotein GldH [Flavobacteriales bacterium]
MMKTDSPSYSGRFMLFVVCMLILGMTLVSCDSTVIFEENRPIQGAVWKTVEPAHFEFEISDTITLHNFYVNLRNGENYPYSNIYFFIDMEFPNGKKSIDTVECFLADKTGKWLGTGVGDIHDNRFLYQHGKQFPMAGLYKIDIRQGMRTDELQGIYDVGFRLSRTK